MPFVKNIQTATYDLWSNSTDPAEKSKIPATSVILFYSHLECYNLGFFVVFHSKEITLKTTLTHYATPGTIQ